MNVVCYVLDPAKALETILEELEKNDWHKGVTIAVLQEDDEYSVLHPEGGEYVD